MVYKAQHIYLLALCRKSLLSKISASSDILYTDYFPTRDLTVVIGIQVLGAEQMTWANNPNLNISCTFSQSLCHPQHFDNEPHTKLL